MEETTELNARDTDKITQLRPISNLDCWVEAKFNCRIIARIVSRDFHHNSVKLYFARKEVLLQVKEIIELLESYLFQDEVDMNNKGIKEPKSNHTAIITLRIVSPYTARYYSILCRIDNMIMRLITAEHSEKITNAQRKRMEKKYIDSLNELKIIVSGYTKKPA